MFDIVLLLVLLVFTAFGVLRGMVRELFSFVTWIGSALAAWALAEDVAPLYTTFISEAELRQMAAFATVFVIAFIVGTLIGLALDKLVNRSAGLRVVNRTFGGALGLVRGAAVVVVLFLLAGLTAIPQRNWWREAVLTPAFERVAVYAVRFLPPDVARHVRYG
jgi:membrane protein required for colicin V production